MSCSTDHHDALLKKAIDLFDQRQASARSHDPEIDTRFFNASLLYLLDSATDHWWCSTRILPLASESLWLFSLPDLPYIIKYREKLDGILQSCQRCVHCYHQSKINLRRRYLNSYPPEKVNHLFDIIEEFDQSRLTASTILPIPQQNCALVELVCVPYYHSKHNNLFCTLFESIDAAEKHLTLEYSQVHNVALLAFHTHRLTRAWACHLLETMANENQPPGNGLEQESVDALIAIARVALLYFGRQRLAPTFELHVSKYDKDGPSITLPATQNNTNIWKGLRRIFDLLSDKALETLITSLDITSVTPMLDLLTDQLNSTPPHINIGGLLKTMAIIWTRLQYRFWGNEKTLLHTDITAYYSLLQRICDNGAYQRWTEFAQKDVAASWIGHRTNNEAGKKLVRNVQEMVDWIFPFWRSFCKVNGADQLTTKVLDMLLTDFQLPVWSTLFRECAAVVAFRVIRHSITEDTGVPVERINRLAQVWMRFAMVNAGEGDDNDNEYSASHLAREPAISMLTDLLYQDSRPLRDAYIALAKSSSSQAGVSSIAADHQTVLASSYPELWDLLLVQLPSGIANILSILLPVYAPLVSIHTIQQQTNAASKSPNSGQTLLLDRITMLHEMVSAVLKIQHDVPWKVRKTAVSGPSMVGPLVSMLAYSTIQMREMTCALMTKHKPKTNKPSPTSPPSNMVDAPLRFLFARQPQLTMTAITHILTDFMELSNIHVETHLLATSLGHVLQSISGILLNDESGYLSESVKTDESDKDEQIIKEYWGSLWQAISIVLNDSYQWSSMYASGDICDMVILWMNVAEETVGCCPMFQNMVCNDLLKMDSLVTAVDGLSLWAHVPQRTLLRKLLPLLEKLLRQLQFSDIKISLDAYDRLVSAVTGLGATMLNPNENNRLSTALRAHEPSKTIFLDDSDDEYMEWHTPPPIADLRIDTPAASSPATLAQQSTAKTPHSKKSATTSSKITGLIDSAVGISTKATSNTIIDVDTFFDDRDSTATTNTFIDGDTFFDDWDDSEPSLQLIKPPPKSVLPSLSASYTYDKNTDAPLFNIPHGTTRTTAPASSLSTENPNKRPLEKIVISIDLEDDSDSDSDLSGLVDIANKKQKLQHQKRSLDDKEPQQQQQQQQQQKNESTNSLVLWDARQARQSPESLNPVSRSTRKPHIRQAAQERKWKKDPNIDQLYKTILSWSLENVKSDTPPPHISSLQALRHVQDTYSSYQTYYDVFEPLLLLEIWSQFIRAKDTLSTSDVMDGFQMASRCYIDDFVDVTFNVPLSIKVNLAVDDLVCVASHFGPDFFFTRMIRGAAMAASESSKGHHWHDKAFLGKVMTVAKGKNASDIVVRCYFPPERITILNSLAPKSTWRCVKVTSLMMVQREYAALLGLQYYELINDLLHPHPAPMPTLSSQEVADCAVRYNVNETQATAIVGALKKSRGFTLIQGPPGTGKTKTILALIDQLLQEYKQQTSSKRHGSGKILVCAPSNAAVDEIVKRLKDGILTTDGLMKPKVVRIGAVDSVNIGAKELVLDRQVDAIVNPSTMPTRDGGDNSDTVECNDDNGDGNNINNNDKMGFSAKQDMIRERIRSLRLEIAQVERNMHIMSNGGPAVIFELSNQRKDLGKLLERQFMMLKEVAYEQQEYTKDWKMSRHRARESILQNCDVVCATLNGSGHQVLFELNMVFDTVIIDEAAQAVEISTLIPLKYDCKRCVLVGDPNQLPPTVISQLAGRFDYEQSLFVRMEKNAPDNVYLLSIQYRMHPMISAFSSSLFYQSKLRDGPKMAEQTAAVWHRDHFFLPFMFFDIVNGQEQQGRGSSLYNSSEADVAVALVDKLAKSYPNLKLAYRIGVIAPYKDQVSHMKLRFERYFGSKISDVIDFNTVDGFQGQEKDIIIFSCVRASSDNGSSIGFVSDIRRMNVGLTRAKKSLFVLGNSDTLLVNRFWRMLVHEAKNQNLVHVCGPAFFRRDLMPGKCPKNVFDAEPGVMQKSLPSYTQIDDYRIPSVTKSSATAATTPTLMPTPTPKRLALTSSSRQYPPYIPAPPNDTPCINPTKLYIPKTKRKTSYNAFHKF